jgi:hypothetical protein
LASEIGIGTRPRSKGYVLRSVIGVIVGLSPASAAELMGISCVKLIFGHEGDWVVDPRELAARLDVRVADLKRLKRRGQVDAKLATGDDEDLGLSRVTVRLPGRGWSGIFDQGGVLISEEMW